MPVSRTSPTHYDSLLAKLIVHRPNRLEAIRAMLDALDECVIEGIATTIPFHKRLLRSDAFQGGRVHTKCVEEDFLIDPQIIVVLAAAATAAAMKPVRLTQVTRLRNCEQAASYPPPLWSAVDSSAVLSGKGEVEDVECLAVAVG